MHHKDLTSEEYKQLMKNPPNNLRLRVYYVSKGRRVKVMKPKKKNKYTLDQIGDALMELTKAVKRIEARLDFIVAANNLKDLPKKD